MKEDAFLSRKTFACLLKEYRPCYEEMASLLNNGVLKSWCKKTKSDSEKLSKYLKRYSDLETLIRLHNKTFLANHLKKDKEYLDSILKEDDPSIVLDEDQRKVVLSDEDYTLVVAGAGAGKTTVLEAKAKYLVEKQHVDPARILLISFTKKATEELKERFARLNLNCKIATFHSLGNEIIAKQEEERHTIVSDGFLFDTLREYLESRLKDEAFMAKINLFFASYLESPLASNVGVDLYKKILAKDDLTTMREDLKKSLDDYKGELSRQKISIQGERVRSYQELSIANFLFLNGIEYEYEPLYPFHIAGSSKPYSPDFKISQNGKEAYLEHYGVSESLTNDRFSPVELQRYKRHIFDKELLHKKHGTLLLHTFSSYNDGKDLIVHLQEELERAGFALSPRPASTLYKELLTQAEDRYFFRLITLLSNFINRFKTDNFKAEKWSDFKAVARVQGDERTLLFLDIANQCYYAYEQALKKRNAIDFQDMINNASDVLDCKIAANEKLPFDYIFVDEYQDISLQRFDMAEKLSKCCSAKILAVGDDWQSIYRFSGSNITLFTDFEKKMGYADVLYLRATHRNSQELIDIAGSFVMKNDLQKKKELTSSKTIIDPVLIYSYDDAYRKQEKEGENPFYRLGEAVVEALQDIYDRFGSSKSVLLLGRYNFEGGKLGKLSKFFTYSIEKKKISWNKHPDMPITFMTAHSSKGLGFDNVIVLNGKDDVLGFPSKIEEDPVMKLVLADNKEIDYAEERRLFYVALTRTKNRVYLITPKNHPSVFIKEISGNYKNIVLNGPELSSSSIAQSRYICPRCGYPLQKRAPKWNIKASKGLTLYVCSNDPEVCGFVTNDISGGKMCIQKCPKCLDGYLIVKKIKKDNVDTGERILGCTNFSKDSTGCDFALFGEEAYGEATDACRDGKVYKKGIPLESCLLAGVPVMDLLVALDYLFGKFLQGRRFSWSRTLLVSYLTGDETHKGIETFGLKGERGFGYLEKKYSKLLYAILDYLVSAGFVIETSKGNFRNYVKGGVPVSEQLARRLFECFVR